jgi:hypothetical protein
LCNNTNTLRYMAYSRVYYRSISTIHGSESCLVRHRADAKGAGIERSDIYNRAVALTQRGIKKLLLSGPSLRRGEAAR